MSDANRDSNFRKLKGVEYVSANNPNKGFSGNHKTKHAVHPSDGQTSSKKTCLLHGPVHSSEECKLPKVYSEKYAAHRPHNEKEACSGGKPKCGKFVKLYRETQ